MRYTVDRKYTEIMRKLIDDLDMRHIDKSRVICVKSEGSKSKYTIARCHSSSKIMQVAFGIKPHYVIELIDKRFYRLSEEDKIKTLIHELLHIPKGFGGGFRKHDFVNRRNVEKLYRKVRVKYAKSV